MPSKETGGIYVAKCPTCRDELVVGWNRGEIPLIDPVVTLPVGDPGRGGRGGIQKIPPVAGNQLSLGPITCTDGNVTMQFIPGTGRATVTWVTAEPVVGNVNLH